MSSQPQKDNFLHQNTSYDILIIKIRPPDFCTAYPITSPQHRVLYSAFHVPGNTRSVDALVSAFQTAYRSVQPFLHSSWQRVPLHYALERD